MKLELKHLVPYVPYMLEVMTINNRRMILMSASLIGYYDDKQVTCEDNKGRQRHTLTGVKPILKPLSDITENINVFVEIFSLCTGINYTKNEIETTFDLRSTSKNYYLLTELNRQISISYDDDLMVFRYFDNKGESNQMKTQLDLFNVLFKNHFDVFGLIPNGLAVDINNLN